MNPHRKTVIDLMREQQEMRERLHGCHATQADVDRWNQIVGEQIDELTQAIEEEETHAPDHP